MKRTLATMTLLNVLGATASAQSSVTIGGIMDIGVGRSIGSAVNAVQESTVGNSRIHFRGTEDLGGGYGAQFGMEHFLRPDTGAQAVADRFWAGYSYVGLRTPYGSLNLGRQYTPAYSMVEGQIDPFLNLSVANLRDVGMRPGAAVQGLSGSPSGVAAVSKVRVSDSVRYDWSGKNINFAVLVGEAAQSGAPGRHKPVSVGANYRSGSLYIGVAYENPQFDNDHQWTAGAKYTVGSATFSLGGAYGRTASDLRVSGMLAGVSYHTGSGDLKFGVAASKIGAGTGAVERERIAVGYHYHLSKRTRIFTHIAHERKIARNRTGADLGIFMRF